MNRRRLPVVPAALGALLTALALAGCDADEAAAASASETASAAARPAEVAGTPADAPAKATETGGRRADAAAKADGASAAGGQSRDQRVAAFRAMAGNAGAEATPAIPVAVVRVERGAIEDYYRGSTNLTAAEEAVVVARTRGVVQEIFAEEGDVVREGDRLAQLETERLRLEVVRSRIQVANLKAAYERAESLNESRMISPTDYDAARFAYQTEQTALQMREFELREATIRATIDGVVTRRLIKVGHTLSENGPAFEMKRLDTIEAELNVPEREMGRIEPGQLARVRVDALAETAFVGDVDRVAPEVDPGSGTFRVTVELDNADGRLKPGMFARVDVRVDRAADALLTPLEAVVVLRDKSSLFVVNDGVAERRAVTTGYVSDGNIQILTGADQGEVVVMTGHEGLRDGAPVRIVEG